VLYSEDYIHREVASAQWPISGGRPATSGLPLLRPEPHEHLRFNEANAGGVH